MKTFACSLIIAASFVPIYGATQALPTNMQKSVSGIIQKKMEARSFASNDPRWGVTLQQAGSAIAGAAAAAAVVTAAGVTAPAWVTAAGTVALSALIGVGIDLAIDGINWLFNSDGSITFSGSGGGVGMTAGGPYWVASGWGVYGGSPDDVAKGFAQRHNVTGWTTVDCQGNAAQKSCTLYTTNMTAVESLTALYSSTGAPVACAGTSNGSDCQAVPGAGGSTVTKSPSDAVNELSEAERAKPLNPAILAKIADAAWQKAAAAPGYQGVPYDPEVPITSADAAAFQSANPGSWPKVQDFVFPQTGGGAQNSGTATDPFKLPNSAAEPVVDTGTTPPVTGVTPDWAIPATNESIGKQSVGVSYTPTIFAAPTGCPSPIQFVIFNKEYAISYTPACDLMTTLAPIFLALGAAAAALIFMESLKS